MEIEKHIQTKAILPEHKRVLLNILFTGNWLNDEITEVLKPFDISTQQFNVLRILKGQKGKPANLSTIQERMIAKNSNTTRLVDKLIKKDLATKVPCKTNKRKVEISITEKGMEFLDQVNHSVDLKERQLTENLNLQELESLNQLLNQLRE
ncbi:MAG: MarR family winged helix-turn-helix transcriptional regulator [Bacteroidota bacterium]